MSIEIAKRSDELSRALSEGDIDRFRVMYQQDSQVRDFRPWLYTAARCGNLEAVSFLLRQGRDPNEGSVEVR